MLAYQEINSVQGGFTGVLMDNDHFGESVASLGDLDGDGVGDLVIGSPGDDGGGCDRGALWIVYLNADATVKTSSRIGSQEGGFTGMLDDGDLFGTSLTSLGDLDGDGVVDLAVGAPGDDDGGDRKGAVWVLFLQADGTVKAWQKTSDTSGELAGNLNEQDSFGQSVSAMGDLDGDGTVDLAVGAPGDDSGGDLRGAVWVLFLRSDGTGKGHQRISSTDGGFNGPLRNGDSFGSSLAWLGELGPGRADALVVGAPLDRVGFEFRGAVWILFLHPDGTVDSEQKINETEGGFTGTLELGDDFGSGLAPLGDLDGDGVGDLAVGSPGDDEGAPGETPAGAVWILFLHADGTVRCHQKISRARGLAGVLGLRSFFGSSLATLGDLDGDGLRELAVGAPADRNVPLGVQRGATWILSVDGAATIDFETADDLATPLANGQEVSSTAGFGRVLDLDGFPASGLTAAVFDSDPLGPNAASSDPDLLVDRGNVLILQEVPGQSVPGIYDVPDDDRFGGDFVLTFKGLEVELLAIDLIDVCPIPNQTVVLTLLDAAGRTRVYTVPSGWTEDLAMDGPPGVRTLDLTTLADQPGFLSTATAAEDSGFQPAAVVMLDVHLQGSGAVDRLVYLPHP